MTVLVVPTWTWTPQIPLGILDIRILARGPAGGGRRGRDGVKEAVCTAMMHSVNVDT